MQMAAFGYIPGGGVSNLGIGDGHFIVDDVRRLVGAPVVAEARVGQEMTLGIVLEGFNGGAFAQHPLAAFEV